MSAGRRALWVGVACAWLGCADGPTTPPNLLLITVDTLRADALACYGGSADVGVEICRLAETGTLFEWAFSAAPYTAPSVASLLTSQYPVEHGVRQPAVSYLADRAVTLAEVLRAHGYATAAFVSNPVLDRNRHLDQGFDVYDQRMTRIERNRMGFEEREAEAATNAAIAWAQVGAREPWFLWVHFQDPHGPYEPPSTSGRPVAGSDPGPPLESLHDDSGLGGIPAYQKLPGLNGLAAYRERYASEIRYLDPHIARLVEFLDSLGRPPGVLLTSDHGEAFGEDGYYFAHGHSVGLDQIRVPLLWRPADGRTTAGPPVWERPVGAVDVAPTLLELAGAPIPASFRGRPLRLDRAEREDEDPRPIYAEHSRRAAVIVGREYYARDRGALPDDQSGRRLPPLPTRTASLAANGESVPYQNASGAEALETLLAALIEQRPNDTPIHESVPARTRDRLRALGYSE